MLLDKIHSPADLRALNIEDLPGLAMEIRTLIIETVSENGGHLAPNLGAVELTLALHYAFNTPQDKLIWDVGHQCYAHKIITGRRDSFSTLRQDGGISGFCNRQESEYDCHTTGHSSNSVSLALGMAAARDLSGEDYKVVAVIGDGSLTGGMALEAIDHAGALDHPLIIVLNDNEMCIDGNVGALSTHLSKMRSNPKYSALKRRTKRILDKIPLLGPALIRLASSTKSALKNLLISGMFFENMGFVYLGPIDGHDIHTMVDLLRQAQTINEPVLLHVRTVKGKGYLHAENHPEQWHGTDPFNICSGKPRNNSPVTYTDVFSASIVELASKDTDIVAITAAMAEGTGLSRFRKQFPERFFDTAIAEQHAAGLAAGLAAGGKKPIFAVYSTFMQRAYDQIIEDICMQPLPVILAIDRAGVVGDGYSHQGIFDIALLRSAPNMSILAPANAAELQLMLEFALTLHMPVAIRYPRDAASLSLAAPTPIEYGKGLVIQEGQDLAIFALGSMVTVALEAAELLHKEGIEARVINARFAAPIDTESLRQAVSDCQARVVTIEEGIQNGGFGEACLSFLAEQELSVDVEIIALPQKFLPHGKRSTILATNGLDAESVAKRIQKKWFMGDQQ